MPIVKVTTNLSRNQLPRQFMPDFCRHLASVLGKSPNAMRWILDTDKTMAMGCEHEAQSKTFLLVEVESLKVFVERDSCQKYTKSIFDYLLREVNGLKEEEIVTKFRDLNPMHVGSMSKIMG